MAGFTATADGAAVAASIRSWKDARAARKTGQAPPASDHELLERLVWEQQQTNKMLWALLSDDQRATYASLP